LEAPYVRVLVVEDDDAVLAMMRSLLTRAGHEPVLASDPRSALEACQTTKPDFALLDIGLPEMDGYCLAEKLRDDCGLDVQMWAVSAHADNERRRRQSGIVGHIQKPISFAHIQQLIGVAN
jgi:two-component system CheB/CheR fusion protein